MEEFKERLKNSVPSLKEGAVPHYAAHFRMLVHRMSPGDLVVLPQKRTKQIAIGRVVGEEIGFDSELDDGRGGNTRSVEWLDAEVDRSAFGQDLLYSFGSFTTLCKVTKNDAVTRVEAVLRTGKDPGWTGPLSDNGDEGAQEVDYVDLLELAESRLIGLIETKFKGEEFATLVEALLVARGYDAQQSDVGPDAGIDIVAVPKLWDANRHSLVVQVKSGGRVGMQVVNNLLGAQASTGASMALLVSWNGFKKGVKSKTLKDATKLQLWDSKDVLREVKECYEDLPETLRSDLPLVRAWVPSVPVED